MLAAFREWGVDAAVRRFIGMFAFALWDAGAGKLYLVRDRLGIKPLYLAHRPGMLLFASELKALLAYPDFPRELDRAALQYFLEFQYVPGPHAIYRNVEKVLPGHIVEIDGDGKITDRLYWDLFDHWGKAEGRTRTGGECEEELSDLLDSSIRYRMISDVPLGAFLSGGIDSSLVVALMRKAASGPVKTFSIGFRESRIRRVAARPCGGGAPRDGPPGEDLHPAGGASAGPENPRCVRRAVRRLVGYPDDAGLGVHAATRHRQPVGGWWGRAVLRVSHATRGSARETWCGEFRGSFGDRSAPSSPASRSTRCSAGRRASCTTTPAEMYFHTVGIFERRRLGEIVPEVVDDAHLSYFRTFRDPRCGGIVERAMATDIKTYLVDDILTKVDRASMAYSLEARVPLLDHRIVEFAARLPMEHKVHGGETKHLLRKILYRHVPREMIDRPKMGFGIPVNRWLRNELRPLLSRIPERGSRAQGGIPPAGRGGARSSGSTCRGTGTTSTGCGRCWSSRCGWSATVRRPDPRALPYSYPGQRLVVQGRIIPQNPPPRYRDRRAATHRYGPNGIAVFSPSPPFRIARIPPAAPRSAPKKIVASEPRHPMKAPIIARSLMSPPPIPSAPRTFSYRKAVA